MKLYEISEAYNSLLDSDLEFSEIEESLKIIDDEFDVKAENIAKLISSINGENEVLRNEEKRLAQRRKVNENKIKGLKEYLFNNLKIIDKKKVETPLYKISIQKNPKKLIIKNDKSVPDEFTKINRVIDRDKLKKAIEDGLNVDYAEVVQEEGLRIR